MKKIISIILIIMLSVLLLTPAYAVEPIGNALLSKVVVSSVSQSTSDPNETISVSVTLGNLNPTALKEVMVGVSGLSSSTLSLTNTFGPFSVDIEAKDSGSVSFDLLAAPNITGGNYPLTLTLTYVDIYGNTVSVNRSISILIDSTTKVIATPKIIVSSYNIGADRIYSGGKFDMTFTLQNTSNDAALNNIVLNFTSESNAFMPVTGVSNQLFIGAIAAGGSYTGKLNLKANSTLLSGIYNFSIGLQYQDVYNNTYSSTASMGIQLVGTTTETIVETASPQVIVASYDIGADQVFGGDEFEMTLTLKNTSSDIATNILLSFMSDANAFIAVPGLPNQLYIGNIAAGESYNGKISLKANDSIISGTYNLNLGLQYQDVYSNAYASATNVSIQLEQKQNLSINSISISDTCVLGSKTLLSANYENPGSSDIKNLIANLSGDILETEKTVLIGTVKAGNSGFIEQSVTPQSAGQKKIEVSFTFEDAAGNSYTTPVRSVTLDVQANDSAASVTDNSNPSATDNETQTVTTQPVNLNSYWIYFVIAGVVLVAAIVGIVWRARYVKNKKTPKWSNSAK